MTQVTDLLQSIITAAQTALQQLTNSVPISTPATSVVAPVVTPTVTTTPVQYTVVQVPQSGGPLTVSGTNPTKFVFSKNPWAPATITGFRAGIDKIDFSPLYTAPADPIADGFIYITADSTGTGANILFDIDGKANTTNPWPNYMCNLVNVPYRSLTYSNLVGTGGPIVSKKLDRTKLAPSYTENFDVLDTSKWSTKWNYTTTFATGCTLPDNGELEWYINKDGSAANTVKPWSIVNGQLVLTADKMPASLAASCNNAQYTSGMIQNSPSFSQQFGYFEILAKLPAGKGLWPAFWLIASNGVWPPEIDVFEVLGDNPKLAYTTIHWTNPTQGHQKNSFTADIDTTQFNTYGFWWDATNVILYINDIEVGRMPTPPELNTPMYVVLNLAVGGSWPGNPDATTQFPAKMYVDYFKAYKINP